MQEIATSGRGGGGGCGLDGMRAKKLRCLSATKGQVSDGSDKNQKSFRSRSSLTCHGDESLNGVTEVCGVQGYEGPEKVTADTPQLVPELDAGGEGDNVASLLREVPFPSWVEQFCRQLLSARTGFSYFLVQSFNSCRNGRDDYIATALFPIPVPFPETCGVGPKKPSQRCRQMKALKKMVHCAVMALNYEHFRAPFSIVPLLRRKPSSRHAQVYGRVMALLRACGPTCGVSVAGCGRKSFQLDARFIELKRCLEFLGLDPRSKYHSSFQASDVAVGNSRHEELRPYRELEASRIKLSGQGQWQCEEFLSDLLYMPFMEPRVNRWPVVPPEGAYPDVEQCNQVEIKKLCLLWDAHNLLTLIPTAMGPGPEQKYLHSRVFGNFKRVDVDRQIGDRRGANFVEGIIRGGPSQFLPTGPSLLQLEVPRFAKVICGSVTDRKDFYHQFAVTFERASTNTVFPSFAASVFAGTTAHLRFLEHFSRRRKPKREEVGDFLGVPESLLVVPPDEQDVFACFSALFQGDHCGVDFACDSHSRLLEDFGCRDPQSMLVADDAVLHNDPATGLVIDDFFAVSIEDRAHCDQGGLLYPGKSSKVLDRAKQVYSEQGIQGSGEKEVRDQLLFKVVGAEINSMPSVVDRGLVSLGAPGEKRLGLAMVSAMLAGLPYTTDALHATLMGSWISALMFRRRVMMAHLNELFQVIPARDLDTDRPQLRRLSRKAAEELLIVSALSPFAASNIAAHPSLSLSMHRMHQLRKEDM